MSALSDDYIKNFSDERKGIFNKRFSDDYDPNESEEINIIRILNEMRELGLADGGRIGLDYLFSKGGRVAYQEGSGYEPFVKTTLDVNPNQTIETPSRIKSDFDKKTSEAFDIGSFISNRNLQPNDLDMIQSYAENPNEFSNFPRGFRSIMMGEKKDPFAKQGYSSDIRHGLGSSALKDQVIDFLGSNLNLNKSGGILDFIGSGAVNIGSLFEEGKDIFSSAESYAKKYPGLTDIQDYDFVPNNEYLTQPFEDIAANYIGSKVPFDMNTRDKLAFLTNYKKYGKQTLDQIKNIKEKRMQEKIRKAEKVTGTTKPGTGGGGGYTPTTKAQNISRTASRVDSSGNVKAYGLAKGGLARMLGE